MRDPEVFPTMNPDLFGEPMKRMKVDLQFKEGTLIPEDIKAVKKELKAAQTSEPFDAFFDVRWTSPLSLIVARSFRTTRFPRRRRRRWRT